MMGLHFVSGFCCCEEIVSIPLLRQELQGSSRKGDQGTSEKTSLENLQSSVPLFLQYPVPYAQDTPTPLLVSQSPSKLHFGNPYSISDSKGSFSFEKSSLNIGDMIDFLFTVAVSLKILLQMMRMSSQMTSHLGCPL